MRVPELSACDGPPLGIGQKGSQPNLGWLQSSRHAPNKSLMDDSWLLPSLSLTSPLPLGKHSWIISADVFCFDGRIFLRKHVITGADCWWLWLQIFSDIKPLLRSKTFPTSRSKYFYLALSGFAFWTSISLYKCQKALMHRSTSSIRGEWWKFAKWLESLSCLARIINQKKSRESFRQVLRLIPDRRFANENSR